MSRLNPSPLLSEASVLTMLKAAIGAAREMRAPCGVAIVDAAGLLRVWALMDGATPLAAEIVPNKARTAAFSGLPTGTLPAEISAQISAAAPTYVTLAGGLPIIADGAVIGGIAAGGESSDTDIAVAQAGLDALTR